MKMKNSQYWKKRFEDLEQSQNNIGLGCYSDIENQYRKAQKQIEGQIATWYQRFADNNGVTMADARKMLTGKELEELKWDINQYIQYGKENAINGTWVKQLENASARYHISRLEALKLQTQQSMEAMFGNQLDSIDSTMRKVYKSGYYHTAYEIQKGVGVGWDFASLDNKTVSKVINKPWATGGKNFSERVWGNRQKLVSELNQTLTQNIILGKDPQQAIDTIAKKMKTSKSAAGRLVMTEEAFFNAAAQKDCFAELDVEQFEIVATLDSHTSEICQDMDGKHFPMSQWEVGVTAPPFHVYCRSTTIPYFDDDFGSVGERAARGEDGKTYYVPADMTYKEWQKSFLDGGDKSGLQEVKSDAVPDKVEKVSESSTMDLKTKIAETNTQIESLKKQFSDITDGYAYDDWFSDFSSIEEGYGEASESDETFTKLKKLDQEIKEETKQRSGLLTQKEKRGQLDTGYSGKIPEEKLDEYNAKAFEQIKKDTGYSDKKATELHDALKEYFGGNYEEILTGDTNLAKIISDGIDLMPTYDGSVYRGMLMTNEDVQAFVNLRVGDTIPQRGIMSSWSSERNVALRSFACTNSYDRSSVLLECESNITGVGVQHISKFGNAEAEVLSSGNYEVVEIVTESKYDYLSQHKNELWFADDLEFEADHMKKEVVCRIKVKEKN
jgi:SPP1 gp7 family putative phage head morphogenesis protein